jgi:hypothetical protein
MGAQAALVVLEVSVVEEEFEDLVGLQVMLPQ